MRFDSSISVDVVNNLCLTNGRGECLWREPTSEDYLYSANERIRYGGINEYDFHARSYHASLPRFDKQDPLNEKYPWLSPYAYCAGNPVMNVDRKGENIVILHKKGSVGHIGMLIQDTERKWRYYSINGTSWYERTGGRLGRKYNDLGETVWDSPEEFMNSSYNNEEDREDTNGYGYEEGVEIESTSEQDVVMSEEIQNVSNTTEYDLVDNNCVTTTRGAMKKAGLKVDSKPEQTNSNIIARTRRRVSLALPMIFYKNIKSMYPDGREIIKSNEDKKKEEAH